jgi:hypothetical protein
MERELTLVVSLVTLIAIWVVGAAIGKAEMSTAWTIASWLALAFLGGTKIVPLSKRLSITEKEMCNDHGNL